MHLPPTSFEVLPHEVHSDPFGPEQLRQVALQGRQPSPLLYFPTSQAFNWHLFKFNSNPVELQLTQILLLLH